MVTPSPSTSGGNCSVMKLNRRIAPSVVPGRAPGAIGPAPRSMSVVPARSASTGLDDNVCGRKLVGYWVVVTIGKPAVTNSERCDGKVVAAHSGRPNVLRHTSPAVGCAELAWYR